MNVKEKTIIDVLKKISAEQDKITELAKKDNQYMAALYALTISTTATEAAKIIEAQSKEIDLLKTQSATATMNPSDVGRRIFITGFSLQEHIIIAELSGKYLVTPTPVSESGILSNVRLINPSQATFIDGAQRAMFNA